MNSINKQKKYLAENLIVESLRLYGTNKTDVENFYQATNGDSIANNLLNIALGDFYEKIEDSERATYLLTLAEDKVQIKEEKAEAMQETGESEHVKQVQETYPAIDIKFLCRNKNYNSPIELDFRFGVYVFWEIIVPHILKISDLVGCKYVYLFAADNSPETAEETPESMSIMWTEDYDPYTDEEEPQKESIRKLVSYYINELKFRPVSEYIILKPHFERDCYTLVQDVSELSIKREQIWSSHDEDNEMNTYQDE